MLSPEKPAASGRHVLAFEVPSSLRALVRARESSLVILGALIGALAGLLVAAMSFAVTLLHTGLFGVPLSERLSAMQSLNPYVAVLVPTIGGLAFGLGLLLLARWRPARQQQEPEAECQTADRRHQHGDVRVERLHR